jgi:A/G-specific adenine glycosylase
MMAPWKDRPGDFNQAVMELGQRVCTPSKPDCNSCPLRAGCLAFQKNSQHLAPAPKLRPEFENVRLALMVPVRRRREGEFEVALVARGQDHKFLKESRGFWYTDGSFTPPAKSENAGSFNHNITRHKIHASVHVIDTKTFPALMAKENPDWIPAGEVEKELIASLDLKAWRLVKRHSLAPTL